MTEPLADTYIVELRKVNKFSQIKKGDIFITSNSPNSCFVAKDNGQIQESPTYGVVEADKFIEVDAKKLIEHAKTSNNVLFQATDEDNVAMETILKLIERTAPELTPKITEAIDRYTKTVKVDSKNTIWKATVKDIIEDKIHCPLPLESIPNLLGINLVSVGGIEWVKQPDNQLVSITINFNPESLN